MKYNVNLDFPIKDLSGEELKDEGGNSLNCGVVIGNNLASQAEGDILKIWGWASALHKGEVLTLDESDSVTFKKLVESLPGLTILVKAQVLKAVTQFS